MMLPTFTINDIRSWQPCYDPNLYLPEDWQGTALDVLKVSACPAKDRLWVVLREETGIPDEVWRAWARWCALQVIDLWDAPEIVRRYLETGTGDKAIRAAAWAAAGAASGAAARDAAWDAPVDKLISMLQEVPA